MGLCATKEISDKENVKSHDEILYSSTMVLHFPLFHEMDSKSRQKIKELFTRKKFSKGKTLCDHDSKEIGIFILVKGAVNIYASPEDKKAESKGDMKVAVEQASDKHLLCTKSNGEWFGDYGMKSNQPSPITAIAISDEVEVLHMKLQAYQEMVAKNPDLGIHILDSSPDTRVRLNSIPLFRGIPETQLVQLQYLTEFDTVEANKVICKIGDDADGLYYIIDGMINVSCPGEEGPVHLACMSKGHWFGEIALLKQTVRTATATATTECKLMKIKRENFVRFLNMHPSIRNSSLFTDLVARRTSSSLKAIPIFSPLITKSLGPLKKFDDSKLSLLGTIFKYLQMKKGDVLFREKDPADSFYILVSGLLVVTTKLHTTDNKEVQLNTIKPNDWFGEVSLLRDMKRTATVKADVDSLLLKLDKKNFSSFLQIVPGSKRLFENRIFSRTSDRLRQIPFFSHMHENKPWSKLDLLGTLFEFEEHKAGTKIVKQGDRADKFFVIVDGKLITTAETRQGKTIQYSVLKNNDWFGEIALLKDTTRTATVTCETDCLLLSITKEKFQKFGVIAPELQEDFQSLLETRTAKSLQHIAPFSSIKENRSFSKLDMLASLLEFKQYLPNTVILQKGMIATRFFVLLDGKVKVCSDINEEKDLKLLQTHENFGGESVIFDTELKDSYVSVDKCVLLALSKVALQRMLEVAPEVVPALGMNRPLPRGFTERLSTRDFTSTLSSEAKISMTRSNPKPMASDIKQMSEVDTKAASKVSNP